MRKNNTRALLPAETKERKKSVPKWLRKAIDMIAKGETQEVAAAACGKARETLNRALHKPHILQFVLEQAKHRMTMCALAGAERLNSLVWGAESENVAAKVSDALVSAAGLGPKSGGVKVNNYNVDARAGWIFDLGPGRVDPATGLRRESPNARPGDGDIINSSAAMANAPQAVIDEGEAVEVLVPLPKAK